jgi:hypothetical protein
VEERPVRVGRHGCPALIDAGGGFDSPMGTAAAPCDRGHRSALESATGRTPGPPPRGAVPLGDFVHAFTND